MAFLPPVIVEAPEAEAAATGLLAWIGRSGALSGAVSLLSLLFGRRNPEPATGNAMRPVVDLLAYPQRAIYILLYYVNHTLDRIVDALTRLQVLAVGLVASERVRASEQIFSVLHWAQSAIASERVRASGQAFSVLHTAQRLVAAEAVRASGQAFSVLHTAQALVAAEAVRASGQAFSVLHTAQALVDQERVRAAGQALSVLAWAQAAIPQAQRAAEARIEAEVVQPTRATWLQLVTELGAATAAAGPDLAGLRSLIRAVPTRAPATLSEAAADPLAIDRVMLRALTDCVIPNCRYLSKTGRDLHGLGNLLGAASFLGFIAYATAHPQEAARDTYAVAGPITDGVASAVRAVVHVG